ncbi:MAG: S-layer homology domain-containing protein [Candidatus Gracilibacteria bacterium]|jgi:hypothetical protein
MKKYLYILLAIILVGGLILGVAKRNVLMGSFSFFWDRTKELSFEEMELPFEEMDDAELAEYYEEEIQSENNKLIELADKVESVLTEIKDFYIANDQDAINTKFAEMETANTNANDSYESAQDKMEKIKNLYSTNEETYATLKVTSDSLEITLKEKMQNIIEADFDEAEGLYQSTYDSYQMSLLCDFSSCPDTTKTDLDTATAQRDYMLKIKKYSDEHLFNVTPDTTISYITKLKTVEPKNYTGIVKTEIIKYAEEKYENLISGIEHEKNSYDDTYEDTTLEAEILGKIKSASMSAQELIANIQSYYNVISEYYAEALAYKTITLCGELTLDPTTYEMESTATSATFDFKVNYDSSKTTTWVPYKLLQATIIPLLPNESTLTLPTTSTTAKYSFTVETDGDGEFYDESTDVYTNPIKIEVADGSSKTVKFKDGKSGDTITVSEEVISDCSAILTITQEEISADIPTNASPLPIKIIPISGDADLPTDADTTDTSTDTDTSTSTDTDAAPETGTDSSSDTEIITITVPQDANKQTLPEEDQTILQDEEYVCEDTFTDTEDHWAQEIICRVFNIGAVSGKNEGIFDPEADITKAEAIKILTILSEQFDTGAVDSATEFLDVDSREWSYPYLVSAEMADIIRIRDFGANYFPNSVISRGDLALYAARAISITNYDFEITYSDFDETDYYAYAVMSMSEKTVDVPYDTTSDPVPVIEGYEDGTFRPNEPITRAEAVAVLYRMYLAYVADAVQ